MVIIMPIGIIKKQRGVRIYVWLLYSFHFLFAGIVPYSYFAGLVVWDIIIGFRRDCAKKLTSRGRDFPPSPIPREQRDVNYIGRFNARS